MCLEDRHTYLLYSFVYFLKIRNSHLPCKIQGYSDACFNETPYCSFPPELKGFVNSLTSRWAANGRESSATFSCFSVKHTKCFPFPVSQLWGFSAFLHLTACDNKHLSLVLGCWSDKTSNLETTAWVFGKIFIFYGPSMNQLMKKIMGWLIMNDELK